MAEYGEIAFLNDLATVLSDLGVEWNGYGNAQLGRVFGTSAAKIKDICSELEQAQLNYQQPEETAAPKDIQAEAAPKDMQAEYDQLMLFFEKMSLKEFKKFYRNNKADLVVKLKRMEALKDAIIKRKK